jgi:hypothetical protein
MHVILARLHDTCVTGGRRNSAPPLPHDVRLQAARDSARRQYFVHAHATTSTTPNLNTQSLSSNHTTLANTDKMCGTDCFLMLLAVLFPPIGGTSHSMHIACSASTPSHFPGHIANTSYSLGQKGHLRRRLPHQHRPLLPRLSPRPAARVVHHPAEP